MRVSRNLVATAAIVLLAALALMSSFGLSRGRAQVPADWSLSAEPGNKPADAAESPESQPVEDVPDKGTLLSLLRQNTTRRAGAMNAGRVRLKAPYRKHTTLPEVDINVVLVRETNPPPDEEAIEWLLVTSLPIDTPEEVLLVVDCYRGRWPIEVFFRVYKTGCQVERIQLETSDRLLRCLMLYKIVAWRVLYLTLMGRECPELPCDLVFETSEWQAVYLVATKTQPPANPPTLNTIVRMVAGFGGFLGRKHDGEPGPQSIWIGLQRTRDFVLTLEAVEVATTAQTYV